MRIKDLWKIGWAPLVILIIHIIITYASNWYYSVHGTDTVMHFMGGMSIALAANGYLRFKQGQGQVGKVSKLNHLLWVIAIVALAAVLWEIMEFSGDSLLYHHPHFQPSNFDTMKDLIMGLSGGTLVALLTNFKRK